MQVLPVAGGWRKVLEEFRSVHVSLLDKYPFRFLVLLIDFDNHLQERQSEIEAVRHRAPPTVRDRVFVLGALTEPEDLRNRLAKPLEDIGAELARECRSGGSATWSHPLLSHNKTELDRLRPHTSILFHPI